VSKSKTVGVRSFVEPLENRQMLSLVVDLRLPGGAKTAAVANVGQVVNMEVWATVKGANTVGSDEGLQTVHGSLLSSNINGGAANGTLKVTLASPFNANIAYEGKQQDLDGDGDLDVGSNFNEFADNYFVARAASMQTGGTVSGATKAFKIGTATFTVTSLKSTTGSTNLVFRGRKTQLSPLWREDNVTKVPSQGGIFSDGAALVITRSGGTTTGTISGKVFNDTNGNGIGEAGELGKSNVRVYLDNDKDGILDVGEANKITDSGGNYSFTGLVAKTYRVRIVGVSGYRITSPSAGYYDLSISGNSKTAYFGLSQKVLITGRLWVDTDKDGIKDSAETVLAGWQVYRDANGNGRFDTGDTAATTDTSGNYSFKSLSAGSFQIRVTQKTGYTRIAPSSGVYSFSLSNGGTKTGQNFRYTKP
jgi:protocatechuate 3,4-dioxygenase beta subunit